MGKGVKTIRSKYVVTDGVYVWTAKTRKDAEKKALSLARSREKEHSVYINKKSEKGLKCINTFHPWD